MATGKRVVVIEDGPTLTHGSMSFGAGVVGARDAGAAEIVDPTPFAVSSWNRYGEQFAADTGASTAWSMTEASPDRRFSSTYAGCVGQC